MHRYLLTCLVLLALDPAVAMSAAQGAAFAERLDTALETGDPQLMSACFDFATFGARVTAEPADAPAALKRDFLAGMQAGMAGRRPGFPIGEIHHQRLAGADYAFLGVRPVDGEDRALFRLITPDGAINYHGWLVATDPDGAPIGGDVFILQTGEDLSTSMQTMWLAVLAEADQGWLAKLTGARKVIQESGPQLERLSKATQAADWPAVLAEYDRLDPSVQEMKIFRTQAINAAMQCDQDRYATLLSDTAARYPGEAWTQFLLIDGLFMIGDHGGALAAVDAIDRLVGGDPYLAILRANLRIAAGRPGEAQALLQAYLAAEEHAHINAFWGLVTVALGARDHAETVRLLDEISRRFAMEWADLTTIPEYAAFVESPEYRTWLARRQGTSP